MADWPQSIPFIIVSPASRQGPIGSVIRNQMDRGPAKARRVQTGNIFRMSGVTPRLTAAQADQFEVWFSDTIGAGALPFTAIDPTDCVQKGFRFVGGYERTRFNGGYRLSFSVETLP